MVVRATSPREKGERETRSNRVMELAVAALLLLTSAYAVAQSVRQVQMSITIVAHDTITLYQWDGATELTNIDLGTLFQGQSKWVPEAPNTNYWVSNGGYGSIRVSYTVQGLPSGVSLEMHLIYADGSRTVVAQGDLSGVISSGSRVGWYFSVSAATNATAGEFGGVTLVWTETAA